MIGALPLTLYHATEVVLHSVTNQLNRNDPKFLDTHVWANRIDPAVWSGPTLFAIQSASFGRITLYWQSHFVWIIGWLQQFFWVSKLLGFYGSCCGSISTSGFKRPRPAHSAVHSSECMHSVKYMYKEVRVRNCNRPTPDNANFCNLYGWLSRH